MPLVVVLIYWGKDGDGWGTIPVFVLPAALSYALGAGLRRRFVDEPLDGTSSMLLCGLAWIVASVFGALPFVLGIDASFLDGYFETVSGFTTTGITVFSGLDALPKSVLFWRAFTQWLGGTGILSFFLVVTFRGGGAHHLFGAESHKISAGRPAPGLLSTLKILWAIYTLFTVLCALFLCLAGMSLFDSICHAFTALSTGGFSPHDASIEYYRLNGYANYRLMDYTLTFFMMLGGMNFLVHYRVLTKDVKALWDNIEVRTWWMLLAGFTLLIMLDHSIKAGTLAGAEGGPRSFASALEETFRLTVFQVVSILTTTGFGTRDIGSAFFPALSKQLFLAMMVIGGCVGSTGGGIKVLRVAILHRLLCRELFKLRVSPKASSVLVIDGKIVPDEEAHRVAALFFAWIALLLIGGGVTALLSTHSGWQSFSGMCSALGNIGPCYLSVPDMIAIHPAVKLTYILGMLAGRLEILPVLLLFSRRAWR